jgi:SAM-dependent methyltransferase
MTQTTFEIEQLKNLLVMTTDTKKHRAYQILASRVKKLIGETDVTFYPKYEEERLEYIESNIAINGMKVLDIGCNTGFFVFELLDRGAKHVTCFEGGEYHSKFVELAVKLLQINSRIRVVGDYFDFKAQHKDVYDVTLLLNVLHHLGDDYGNNMLTRDEAKRGMIVQLNEMSTKTKHLVFQMGFNWKGDISKCLFENGLKTEMIDYIKDGTSDNWEVVKIGVAEGSKQQCSYRDVNDDNVLRKDALGEFLNRPLFILKSKQIP